MLCLFLLFSSCTSEEKLQEITKDISAIRTDVNKIIKQLKYEKRLQNLNFDENMEAKPDTSDYSRNKPHPAQKSISYSDEEMEPEFESESSEENFSGFEFYEVSETEALESDLPLFVSDERQLFE